MSPMWKERRAWTRLPLAADGWDEDKRSVYRGSGYLAWSRSYRRRISNKVASVPRNLKEDARRVNDKKKKKKKKGK